MLHKMFSTLHVNILATALPTVSEILIMQHLVETDATLIFFLIASKSLTFAF